MWILSPLFLLGRGEKCHPFHGSLGDAVRKEDIQAYTDKTLMDHHQREQRGMQVLLAAVISVSSFYAVVTNHFFVFFLVLAVAAFGWYIILGMLFNHLPQREKARPQMEDTEHPASLGNGRYEIFNTEDKEFMEEQDTVVDFTHMLLEESHVIEVSSSVRIYLLARENGTWKMKLRDAYSEFPVEYQVKNGFVIEDSFKGSDPSYPIPGWKENVEGAKKAVENFLPLDPHINTLVEQYFQIHQQHLRKKAS